MGNQNVMSLGYGSNISEEETNLTLHNKFRQCRWLWRYPVFDEFK